MLQHLRPGKDALLCYMPYKDYCHSAAFGIAHKPRGTFPHLTYAALSAVCLLKIYRLHGIHNGKAGFYSVNFRNYVRKLGLSKHKQAVAAHAQTIRPELYLLRRFLRGGIYYGVSARCHISGKLKQQRAFAYAGVAAAQDKGAGHNSAPGNRIKLCNAGGKARV